MAGKGLIISIDYNDENCQACFYSVRHQQAESISAGTDIMRYLIPSILCFDPETREWSIGNYAYHMMEKEGVCVFRNLLANVRAGASAAVNNTEYSYTRLFALFFRKLVEFIQIHTSVMSVENITVTMKYVDREDKLAFENIFRILQIPDAKVRLLSHAESFGCYMISEQKELWRNGALLFDFSSNGFFVKQLDVSSSYAGPLLFISEYDLSDAFSVQDLASEMLRLQLDRKLNDLYQDLVQANDYSTVYFTGEGFDEQWFTGTLANISGSRRAFKGNNIYVKGACMAGYMRAEEKEDIYPIICAGRTKISISIDARDKGNMTQILLSPAAAAWYDAGYEGDFILEQEDRLVFYLTSLLSGKKTEITLDLSDFPARPSKTTRVEIAVVYRNESECDITVTDKGFGDFFSESGAAVTCRLQMDAYL